MMSAGICASKHRLSSELMHGFKTLWADDARDDGFDERVCVSPAGTDPPQTVYDDSSDGEVREDDKAELDL